MVEIILLAMIFLFLGCYGALVDHKVDKKHYETQAKRKTVVRWDDDKAA